MPNLIVISLDTLRADRLSSYGYPKPTSPYLDAIAAQGVRFSQAYATDIPTEVAHTALFSGRYGAASGIVGHGHPYPALPSALTWLPERLRSAGFTTAAVDNLYQMKPWFARGFHHYINMTTQRRWIDGADVTAEAISWLKSYHQRAPFFLFVHYWDPHSPYLPPDDYLAAFYDGQRDPFDPGSPAMEPAYNHLAYPFFKRHHYDLLGPVTDPEYLNARYDAEVRYLDDQLQQLDQALRALNRYDDTWLILLADHGESLTEHDIFWDHCGLYDSTVRVPVIMRWPHGPLPRNHVVSELVQPIDLTPTIYEGLGIPKPEPLDGHSLWPLLQGQPGWRRNRVYLSECAWAAARGIRTREYKYIETRDPGVYERPTRELYRLTDDPDETQNLITHAPAIAAMLAEELARWVRHWGKDDPMDPIVQQGLPFVRRMEHILHEVGLTWDDWKTHPDRARYDQALARMQQNSSVQSRPSH